MGTLFLVLLPYNWLGITKGDIICTATIQGVINQSYWMALSMLDYVINRIHRLARINCAPEGLTITNRYMDENDFDDDNDSIYQPYNDKPDDTKDDDWTYNTDQEDNV